MQTFVPFADLKRCAEVLDYKRLGKQRVETLQIMSALTGLKLENTTHEVEVMPERYHPTGMFSPSGEQLYQPTRKVKKVDLPPSEWQVVESDTPGWFRHPATQMWLGHTAALLDYQESVCYEWVYARGYRDTCLEKTAVLFRASLDAGQPTVLEMPAWWGDERVHSSHRSNLLRKLPSYYSQYGWDDDPDAPYYWPDNS